MGQELAWLVGTCAEVSASVGRFGPALSAMASAVGVEARSTVRLSHRGFPPLTLLLPQGISAAPAQMAEPSSLLATLSTAVDNWRELTKTLDHERRAGALLATPSVSRRRKTALGC